MSDRVVVLARPAADADSVAEIAVTKNQWGKKRIGRTMGILEVIDTSASMYCLNCAQGLSCNGCRLTKNADYSLTPAGVLEKVLIKQPPEALRQADQSSLRNRVIFGGTAELSKTHGAMALKCLGSTNFSAAFETAAG